eukprot:403350715
MTETKIKKRDRMREEFKGEVLQFWLNKRGINLDELNQVLINEDSLKLQFDKILNQFDGFKDKKPEPLDIYISKFNQASMKTIYKKYLGYLRYLVYHEVRDVLDYPKRFQLHFEILANEQHLKEIFNLYVMNFDHLHPSFEKDVEGAYFREFKKAYYQLMFEKTWLDDVGEIESQHIQCIALILRYANQIKVMTDDLFMSENTIEFKNQDYGVKYDLPFEITSIISDRTKEYLRIQYIVMMSHVLSLYPKTICFLQVFNINSSVNKLRIYRDKLVLRRSFSIYEKQYSKEFKEKHEIRAISRQINAGPAGIFNANINQTNQNSSPFNLNNLINMEGSQGMVISESVLNSASLNNNNKITNEIQNQNSLKSLSALNSNILQSNFTSSSNQHSHKNSSINQIDNEEQKNRISSSFKEINRDLLQNISQNQGQNSLKNLQQTEMMSFPIKKEQNSETGTARNSINLGNSQNQNSISFGNFSQYIGQQKSSVDDLEEEKQAKNTSNLQNYNQVAQPNQKQQPQLTSIKDISAMLGGGLKNLINKQNQQNPSNLHGSSNFQSLNQSTTSNLPFFNQNLLQQSSNDKFGIQDNRNKIVDDLSSGFSSNSS